MRIITWYVLKLLKEVNLSDTTTLYTRDKNYLGHPQVPLIYLTWEF